MIPTNRALQKDFEIITQPTKTYQIDSENKMIRGTVDGREAMKQAIYKILSTERYESIIYSWNYGVELAELYGKPLSYVCPELERRIKEALLWDDRILNVSDFAFDTTKKGEVTIAFTVTTIYGEIPTEKAVKI